MTPPPAPSLSVLRAWMRDQGIADGDDRFDHTHVQPVAPLALPARVAHCPHCTLPTRAGTAHAPCAQAAGEPTP